jgi:glucans biosynthesis protein
MPPVSRRQFLAAGAPWVLAMVAMPGFRAARATGPQPRFGAPGPFNFELLRQKAKALAEKPYVAPAPAPDIVRSIDFDTVQSIKFRADRALWPDGPGAFPVRFFHVDMFNGLPVRINELSQDTARELIYSIDDFDYGRAGLAAKLPMDLGFSGFRVMDGRSKETDWLAFQGASYFRTCGEENQYGASARGIAVNTATDSGEEFPRFVEFWLCEPNADSASVTIFALLDGPSLTAPTDSMQSKAAAP